MNPAADADPDDQQHAQPQDDDDDNDDKKDKWKPFVLQTDWSGPIMQETWYQGHGNPCRRLALWVHLSSLLATMVLFGHALTQWPILQLATRYNAQRTRAIQQSHTHCLQDICTALVDIEFDCQAQSTYGSIVLDEATLQGLNWEDPSTLVVDSSSSGWVARIPLPETCHHAMEQTFGETSSTMSSTHHYWPDLLHIPLSTRPPQAEHTTIYDPSKSSSTTIQARKPLLQVLTEECMIYERIVELLLFGGRNGESADGLRAGSSSSILSLEALGVMDLVQDPLTMAPGARERVRLRSLACPKYMSSSVQKELLPALYKTYNFLWEWRISGALCVIYWANMAYYAAISATNVFLILPFSTALWLFGLRTQPKLRGKSITLLSTISTVLLLVTLADDHGGGFGDNDDNRHPAADSWATTLRAGILIASALFLYDNPKAAMEWAFLLGLSSLNPSYLSDTWDEHVLIPLKALGSRSQLAQSLLVWIYNVVDIFIPGLGVWKLVTLYVVYYAYPRPSSQRR